MTMYIKNHKYIIEYIKWILRRGLQKVNLFKKMRFYQKKMQTLQSIVQAKKENKVCVAYHGMERNGTNFLALCLTDLKCVIVNHHFNDRRKFGHKHYRWNLKSYGDLNFYNKYYMSDVAVSTVQDLNTVSGFPASTVHVVIQKQKMDACVSFLNFGLRSLYYRNKAEAIQDVVRVQRDYDYYYEFWAKLREKEPQKVFITEHQELLKSPRYLIEFLLKSGCEVRSDIDQLYYNTVPMSPRYRSNIITKADIL